MDNDEIKSYNDLSAGLADSLASTFTYTADGTITALSADTGYSVKIDPAWWKESLGSEALKAEFPEDKTSVDLAKVTAGVIIDFLRSDQGIALLATELEKYFGK